jgi:glycosyltransferase involved in cell wall biosynthesis
MSNFNSSLLINLSFLIAEPTGLMIYGRNIFPYLQSLNPTLLTANNIDNFNCYSVPANLSADYGTQGHLRRLLWTQLNLPKISQKLQSNLLFSPIPEAPLNTNTRYIVTVHDLIPLRFPNPRSPLTYYSRYYIPQVLSQAEHILCNSVATAKDICDYFQIPEKKITPILLAHNNQHFRFLDLPTSNYFLYIGRHDKYKNLQRLIDAFAALPSSFDGELWIAGPTAQRFTPRLQEQATHLGVSNQVKFLNYVTYEQLPIIINQAIALVFPSLWEGFGLPVLEAMACGTPVITSNISALPEVAGDAAILVNPYDTDEITEAMQTLAKDSGLRANLRTLSLKQASKFSWEKTGLATAEVLKAYM